MSTYAVVLCARRQDDVRRWVARHAQERDVLEAELAGATMFLVARDVHRYVSGSSFHIGVTADPAVGVGFGRAGWREARGTESVDGAVGEFLRVTWGSGQVDIERDLFGVVHQLTTQGPGVAAVSDSLLVLRDLREALGWRSTPNVGAATARTRTLALMLQQMSPETLVSEIEFVPGGRSVRLTKGRWRRGPSVSLQGGQLVERVAAVSSSRDEVTRIVAGRCAGMIRGLASSRDVVPSLTLSGGVDSRMILAATRRAGVQNEMLIESWNTSAANAPDFEVAQALAGRYGFALNQYDRFETGGPLRLAPSSAPIFASTHLGVYDRVLPASGVLHHPRRIRLNGLGAELAKGNYKFRPMSQVEHWLTEEAADRSPHASARFRASLDQLKKGLGAIGVSTDEPDALEWHYAAYRGGLHGGGHTGLMLGYLRPLQQLELLALGHIPDEGARTFERARETMNDLLLVLDPELARQPYAPPTVPRDEAWQRRRLEELGGPLTDGEIPSLAFHGTPADSGGGSHSLGLSIAEAWGFGDEAGQDPVGVSEPWVAAIADPTLRDLHADLARLSTNELRKANGVVNRAGGGPAKRLSAVVLARG